MTVNDYLLHPSSCVKYKSVCNISTSIPTTEIQMKYSTPTFQNLLFYRIWIHLSCSIFAVFTAQTYLLFNTCCIKSLTVTQWVTHRAVWPPSRLSLTIRRTIRLPPICWFNHGSNYAHNLITDCVKELSEWATNAAPACKDDWVAMDTGLEVTVWLILHHLAISHYMALCL